MGQGYLSDQRISPEFLAQGAAIQAEYAGSLALVALCVVHDRLKQRPFYFTNNQIVQISRTITV